MTTLQLINVVAFAAAAQILFAATLAYLDLGANAPAKIAAIFVWCVLAINIFNITF